MIEPRTPGSRVADRFLWAVGCILLALGLWSTLRGLGRPPGPYDEGILLSGAHLISIGQVPYRDFYSNYPPGAFLAIAGLWKVFGVSVGVERALGVAAHLAIALGSGWVAALMRGTRFSAPTAGVVLIWLAWLGTPAYAWLLALGCGVLACGLALRASERGTRGAWIVAGVALGTVGCFRHDLFVYLVAGLFALALLWAVVVRRLTFTRAERTSVGWLTLGAALPLALVWLPTLALAGVRPVVDDLYLTQVRRVMPARVLPMPELTPLVSLPPLPFPVPAFIGRGYEGAVALTLTAPVLALLALGLAPRLGWRGRLGPALLIALGAAVVPQMVGRSDPYHSFLTAAPGLLILCAVVESLARAGGWPRAVAVAAWFGVMGIPIGKQLDIPAAQPSSEWQRAYPRYGKIPEPEGSRERVLAFIEDRTAPGEPIYVGQADHSRIFVSEMDLYYLSGRPGGTRIMQFDPNVVNRADVQRQMATELDATRTRVAVLSSRFSDMVEPNESAVAGSTFLDEYFRTEFEVAERAGPYQLLVRRGS
ncbi:MAG: hypothetical protein FJ207_02590 [Gemmatimonadetes bacterium]|nr:hypothetical protein [Gemmatimonadota bacterium]